MKMENNFEPERGLSHQEWKTDTNFLRFYLAIAKLNKKLSLANQFWYENPEVKHHKFHGLISILTSSSSQIFVLYNDFNIIRHHVELQVKINNRRPTVKYLVNHCFNSFKSPAVPFLHTTSIRPTWLTLVYSQIKRLHMLLRNLRNWTLRITQSNKLANIPHHVGQLSKRMIGWTGRSVW
jgi:hypothetical protein